MLEIAAGRLLGGKYRLKHRLGAGGMGEVWAAVHVELGSDVAVKLMSPLLLRDEAARARFRREARAAARLKSPHVVAVHDYGEDGETPYLVMELLEGRSLQEHVAEARPSLAEAAELVAQACRGLELAHARGIVHRDIKPSNLFLADVQGQEQIKIVDFGIARALADDTDSNVTRSGAILGSPAFMSPEQASAGDVSPASDLWSLAAVTYWMLLGREPFAGRMISETLYNIRTGSFVKPTDLAPELPAALDVFFAKALAVDPAERFQSAQALASAVRAIATGSASQKLPPVTIEAAPRRGANRRWARAVMAAGAAALLVVLLALASRSARAPSTTETMPAPQPGQALEIVTEPPRHETPAAVMSAPAAAEPARTARRVRATNPAPTALTREPDVATPAPGRDSTDPLFGIPVKARQPSADAGAGAAPHP